MLSFVDWVFRPRRDLVIANLDTLASSLGASIIVTNSETALATEAIGPETLK